MATSTSLEEQILSEIAKDRRVPHPVEVAVAADGKTVTLRGTVESFAQRRAAEQDAKRLAGGDIVKNELKVNLLGEWRRGDDEIRGIALQSLAWDAEVPPDAVDVKVEEGWVTLKGQVEFQFESDAAFDDVASLYGVIGVSNEIKVVTP